MQTAEPPPIVETLRRFLDGSPQDPGNIAPGLVGWQLATDIYVCARCAGRIMARGCQLPPNSTPVWHNGPIILDGRTEEYLGQCQLCGR